MRKILTSLMLIASAYSFAQVGISAQNTDAPQATLDISSIGGKTKTNGILIPRVSRVDADDMAKPPKKTGAGKADAIVESTLIYIDDISGKTPTNYATNVRAEGFYYFKDGKWVGFGEIPSPVVRMSHFSNESYTLKPTDGVIVCDNGSSLHVTIPATEFVEGRNFVALNNNCHGGLIFVDSEGNNVLSGNSYNVDIQEGIGQHLYYDGNKWFNTTGY